MAVRPINAINLKKYIKGLDVSLPYDKQDKDDVIRQVCCIIDNWPTLTPPNELLTLGQLREMDGEPVWVTPLGFWALVIAKPGERVQFMSNDGETVWADKEIELVGPVYRRPPEGEGNA